MLQLNQWQHVCFVYSVQAAANVAYMYVNGVLWATANVSDFNNVVRTTNFIGKSNWGDPNVNAIFDEIKIFSVALTQSQVQFEMTNDYYTIVAPASLFFFF